MKDVSASKTVWSEASRLRNIGGHGGGGNNGASSWRLMEQERTVKATIFTEFICVRSPTRGTSHIYTCRIVSYVFIEERIGLQQRYLSRVYIHAARR